MTAESREQRAQRLAEDYLREHGSEEDRERLEAADKAREIALNVRRRR